MVEIERRRRESRNGDGEDRELRISKCTVGQWGGGFEVKTGNSSARRATKENGETIFSGELPLLLHAGCTMQPSWSLRSFERYSSPPVAVKSVE